MANLTLNDDRSMPQLGMGTWQIKNVTAATIVRTGLDVGFQLVDTAAAYDNEMGVGDGIKGNDVWITTSFGTRGTVTLPRRWRKAWRCSGSTQWTYT